MFSPHTRQPAGIAGGRSGPCSALTQARDGWCAESSERACSPSAYSVVFSPSSFSVTTTSRPAQPGQVGDPHVVGGDARATTAGAGCADSAYAW